MRKVKALIRNEIINFKRSKLALTMIIVYLIGIRLSIYTVFQEDGSLFTLSGFIKNSWMPLNLVMIPFLIFSVNIGKSNNEIFDTIDISPREKVLAKTLMVGIISTSIFVANIIVLLVIGIICRVSIGYLLYQSLGYILNTITFLIACGAIGLFIGQVVSRKIGDVLAFIMIISIFIVLCNFYKFRNFIAPLYNIRQFPSNFDIFNYDKTYFYHNFLWIIISYIILKAAFYREYKREKGRLILPRIIVLGVAFGLSIFLIINLHSLLPDFVDMGTNVSKLLRSKSAENVGSFTGGEEKKYYAYKYNMNMDIDTELRNSCEIGIKILQDNISSLDLGLYNKLNIYKLEIDGTKLDYKRTDNSVVINLPKEYKNGDIVSLKIDYEGKINTVWGNKFRNKWESQYRQLFYVKKNLLALGGLFEWYPKQNDGREKEYTLNIKYNSKNKLYSNLEGSSSSAGWNFEGSDTELVLVSGHNIKEREYKGNIFIGNEEYINSNKICDHLLNSKEKDKALKEVKKFIQVPLSYSMKECYRKIHAFK